MSRHPDPDPELALAYVSGSRDPGPVLAEARRLRDEGYGRTVTYSRKVFIPLTTLCRDRCAYCTFAKPPRAGGMYLEPDEVLALAEAGAAAGCTEALFTLGDRPEDRWREAGEFLAAHGHSTTIGYVEEMARLVVEETPLFPHANPGVMSEGEIGRLRPVSLSMGLMLENVSPRLTGPGMVHDGSPDKDPGVRMATIEAAGRRRVPFTTGILVGIGETPGEVVDSLFALDRVAAAGHVQEVIIQNFRAKADTRMRRRAEPVPAWTAVVVAVARWILGPAVSVQVPPNLTERFEVYLDAGVNDWGGVSPVTIDWVNPEAPWPHLDELAARTAAAGFELRARLPAYPRFLTPEWVDGPLLAKARAAVDTSGLLPVEVTV